MQSQQQIRSPRLAQVGYLHALRRRIRAGFTLAELLIATGIIHVAYYLLVGLAYRSAGLSVIYPIMRGSAPMATALFSSLLIGEALGPAAWAGIALLCAGVLGLGLDGLRANAFSGRAAAIARSAASRSFGHYCPQCA